MGREGRAGRGRGQGGRRGRQGDGREEETDLTIASEFITPAAIATLRKEAGGLICMTLSADVRQKIGLPFMADVLRQAGHAYPILEAVSNEDLTETEHAIEFSYEGSYELDEATLADGSILDDHFSSMGGWISSTLVRLGDLNFEFLPPLEKDED